MTFNIRSATENDIPALAHIHVQGWKDAYKDIVDQDYLDNLKEEDRIEGWLERFDKEGVSRLIAETDDGRPAGLVAFGKLRTPPPGSSPIRPLYSSEIYAIYILSDFWRQGLGTQLIKKAVTELQDMRHKSMCLWVMERNKNAIAFYKKLGGQRCGKKKVDIGPTTGCKDVCFGWRDTKGLIAL